MKQYKNSMIGELLFRTIDGNRAAVQVYRSKGTFTLKRRMQDGIVDERTNIDVYGGRLDDYVAEATLKWSDLEREGVEPTPHW